jgi:hypothetical protein
MFHPTFRKVINCYLTNRLKHEDGLDQYEMWFLQVFPDPLEALPRFPPAKAKTIITFITRRHAWFFKC